MKWKESFGAQKTQLRKTLERYKLVLLVIAVGVILLTIPNRHARSPVVESQTDVTEETFHLQKTEERFSRALSEIEGAGEVTVVLTVKTGSQQILAENSECSQKDSEVEKETSAVILSKGSGVQETVKLQEIYPEYQGALIICSGADSPSVKFKLMEATSALTGLGADKISICKGK